MRRRRFAVRAAIARWIAVAVYALAMAYVESAAVVYLRTVLGGIDPLGPRQALLTPLPAFDWIEIGREAATMVMLAAVGYLAASSPAGRIGAFAVAFGVWDIFYYVFLWLFTGWPDSPFSPDVLFLIPVPWWGPVLSPVLVAVVIVVAGAATMARELGDGLPRPARADCVMILLGIGLCLLAFLANSFGTSPRGVVQAAYSVRQLAFPWPVYGLGLCVGTAGLIRALSRVAA